MVTATDIGKLKQDFFLHVNVLSSLVSPTALINRVSLFPSYLASVRVFSANDAADIARCESRAIVRPLATAVSVLKPGYGVSF
jgi:hypothetical protein